MLDTALEWIRADPVGTTGIFVSVSALIFTLIRRRMKGEIKKHVGLVLDGVAYWVGRYVLRAVTAQLSLKHYCRLMSRGGRTLHVPSLRELHLDLDTSYVSPSLTANNRNQYNDRDFLSVGDRVRVVGDPGSGKSTLVKRAFRLLCEDGMQTPGKARFPIRFKLRGLHIDPAECDDSQLGGWLWDRVCKSVGETEVFRIKDCLDSYSKTNGVALLLDGLDEVATESYARVEMALNALSALLRGRGLNNIIVLTLRTQFHVQVRRALEEEYPATLRFNGLTPTDVYTFLCRWPFDKSRDASINRIYGRLAETPTLMQMCSNPLVLAMYVADQMNEGQPLPETRTEFYQKVTNELLHERRRKQDVEKVNKRLREQRTEVLGRLAFEHLLNEEQPTNQVEWGDAVALVARVVDISKDASAIYLRELSKDTGLFTEEQPEETLSFIHLTFCEFLAAMFAAQREPNGWETLLCRQSEMCGSGTRLHETIAFTAGLLPPYQVSQAIDQVLELAITPLSAAVFFETQRYDHVDWASFVESYWAELNSVPEAEKKDPDWAARLHTLNVLVYDANACRDHGLCRIPYVTLESKYKEMLQHHAGIMQQVILAYAKRDAVAAFRLAEQCGVDVTRDVPELIIDSSDQGPFLAVVLSEASSDSKGWKTWIPLIAEAGLRSAIVRSKLLQLEPVPSWSALAQRVPQKKRWYYSYPPRTFYTECVSIAYGLADAPGCTTRLRALAEQPPPNLRAYDGWVQRVDTMVDFHLVPFVFLGLSAGILVLCDATWQVSTVTLAILVAGVMALMVLASRSLHRTRRVEGLIFPVEIDRERITRVD